MTSDEICWLDATDLSLRIRRRELSVTEVVESYLARIYRMNPRLNALLTILADSALADASRADARVARGRVTSPMLGVPVVVKDIISTRGTRTTMGSRIFADYVPDHDAAVVERLRGAGAIILGKAHTHEFAYGPTSNNPHYGPCRNPWNLDRIPGGSSGGSASSVAAALAPIGIGTDTGGSVRVPAALCGVVGLKPTYGRISRFGVFPCSWALDHVGTLTRTVRDTALTLAAIAGPDARDGTASRTAVPDYTLALTGDIRGVRIGVLREHLTEAMDEDVAVLVRAATGVLRDLGAVVEEVSIPSSAYARPVSTIITAVDSLVVHEPLLRTRGEEYGADVRQRFPLAVGLRARDYVRAQQARTRIVDDTAEVMKQFDVLVGATVPIPAPMIGQDTVVVRGEERATGATLSVLSRVGSLTGYPTVTQPCGLARARLPVGIQIMGRPFDEAMVLRVAESFERVSARSQRPAGIEDARPILS